MVGFENNFYLNSVEKNDENYLEKQLR